MRIVETMPVPIVTLNQDGLKFRTIRRHPRSDLETFEVLVCVFWTFSCSPVGSEVTNVLLCPLSACCKELVLSTAGVVTAGLSSISSHHLPA